MTIDFSFILTMATALCGLVWGLYVLWLRWGRNGGAGHQEENQKEPVLVEYARSFFPVLLIVLIVRSFLFEPFRIPSSSIINFWILVILNVVMLLSSGCRRSRVLTISSD